MPGTGLTTEQARRVLADVGPDVLLLAPGDRVPADATLVSASDLPRGA